MSCTFYSAVNGKGALGAPKRSDKVHFYTQARGSSISRLDQHAQLQLCRQTSGHELEVILLDLFCAQVIR